MKKTLRRTGIVLIGAILVVAALVAVLFWNELRSLMSIKKVDDYGMFQMTYYGDYGFDDFLETGAENDGEIEAFVAKRLLKGLPVDLGVTGAGCTAFVTRNESGEILYGRNFDFSYAPSLQVVTKPDNGYASISTVNLSFAGYSKDKWPSGLNLDRFLALAAPFLPFDGVNEKGLAIALLSVPEAALKVDARKITLNTTTAIRLVLDHAATVDEAIDLLRQYNIYFSGGIDCHFLLGDAGGQSAIVEYYDGELQIITTDEAYQIASNFVAYNGLNIGEGFTEFERYNTVKATIDGHDGQLREEQAIALLADVGVIDGDADKLQWSVLYNLSTLEGTIFAHRNTGNLIRFKLHA